MANCKPAQRDVKICPKCGETFVPRSGKQIYCCTKCGKSARRQKKSAATNKRQPKVQPLGENVSVEGRRYICWWYTGICPAGKTRKLTIKQIAQTLHLQKTAVEKVLKEEGLL